LFDAVLKTHLIIRMVYPLVRKFHAVSGTLLGLLLLTVSVKVLAHGGHGNEFQSGAASQPVGAIKVDAATAQRLGLKVEPVKRQSFAFGIKTTGQLETLPNQKVEVTTPVTGTIIKLLVSPGVKVSKGQAVAILSSPELAPVAGTVADGEATLGESGQDAGKRIMTILGDRTILLSANIYEKDLDKVQVGQRVNIKVAAPIFMKKT
jgi:multidrug resistance efflux pump